jgi:hypothetical protein
MHNKECIREPSRRSMKPGTKEAKHGEFCFVWYDDDCDCIAGSRLIHTVYETYDVKCETKEVAGHRTSHFEPAWRNGLEVSIARSLTHLEPAPQETH